MDGDEYVARGKVAPARRAGRFPGPAWLPPGLAGASVLALVVAAVLLMSRPAPTTEDTAPQPFRGTVIPGPDLSGGVAVAVALEDGRVLLVPGDGTASLLDPRTGEASPAGSGAPAGDIVGIALADGRALLVAHRPPDVSTAAVFDPSNASFHDVALPDRRTVIEPTLTRLADGRVLVTGGREHNYAPEGSYPAQDLLTSHAMVFDPAAGRLEPTGDMILARQLHAAVALPDGRVLVVGGTGPGDVELYDPVDGRFTTSGAVSAVDFATRGLLLPDDRILLVHWTRDASGPLPAREPVGIFDPAAGRFTATAPVPGAVTTTTGLPDGHVFVTGLIDLRPDGVRPWSGIYDPADGTTREVALLPGAVEHALRLADGEVLLIGRAGVWMTPSAPISGR